MTTARVPTEGTVTPVDLSRIVADPAAWPRAGVDERRVAEFVELYREDDSMLPPLDVVPAGEGDGLVLADGWHRLHALRHLKADRVLVRVVTGSDGADPRTVAYRHGLLLAATAGLPLTRTDRITAVRRLLEEQPDWSDRQIGRACGVSHSTVAKYRRGEVASLATSADSDDESSAGGYADDGYVPEQTTGQTARTLVRGLARLDEKRGLFELMSGKRAARQMGSALAEALADQYDDDPEQAVTRARAWADWLTVAVTELETGLDTAD